MSEAIYPHPKPPPGCSCMRYDHHGIGGENCRCEVFAPLLRMYLFQLGHFDRYVLASVVAREWRALGQEEEALKFERWGPRPERASGGTNTEFRTD